MASLLPPQRLPRSKAGKLLLLLLASGTLWSGCATYEALTGRDSAAASERVDAITAAAQADLEALRPLATAAHPLAGVGIEIASGAAALIAALFGTKQRRDRLQAEAAVQTLVTAIEKAGSADIKSAVARKSAHNGTAPIIARAVDKLPVG